MGNKKQQLYRVRIKPEFIEQEKKEMEGSSSAFKPSIIDGCLAMFGKIALYSRGEAIKKAHMFNGTIEKAPEIAKIKKQTKSKLQQQEDKLNEHIIIAAIISENHFKKVYENPLTEGYFDALDVVKEATKAFYKRFKTQIETPNFEWEEYFAELNKKPYLKNVICFDDLVIYWSEEWLIKYLTNGRVADIEM